AGAPHFIAHLEFAKGVHVGLCIAFELRVDVAVRESKSLETRDQPRADVVVLLDNLGDRQGCSALVWIKLDLRGCRAAAQRQHHAKSQGSAVLSMRCPDHRASTLCGSY